MDAAVWSFVAWCGGGLTGAVGTEVVWVGIDSRRVVMERDAYAFAYADADADADAGTSASTSAVSPTASNECLRDNPSSSAQRSCRPVEQPTPSRRQVHQLEKPRQSGASR